MSDHPWDDACLFCIDRWSCKSPADVVCERKGNSREELTSRQEKSDDLRSEQGNSKNNNN